MLGVNNNVKNGLLNWECIKDMNKMDDILVNSNRLYFQLSMLSRLQNKKTGVDILTTSINGIKDEKQMYISMKVGDVLECFEKNSSNLPLNTFRLVHDKERAANVYKTVESANRAMYRKKTRKKKKRILKKRLNGVSH